MLKFDLDRNHKLYLAFAGVLFVGSLAGSWFVWRSCVRLDEEETGLQTQIAKAREKIRSIDQLEHDVIILRENLREYVRILPSNAEVNDFYSALNEFGRASGVVIQKIDPKSRGKIAGSKVFDQTEYQVAFRGTYDQFLQFTNRIENHERFTSISEIRLKAGSPRDEQDGAIMHDVRLTVVTYVYTAGEGGSQAEISGYERKRERLAEQIREARHDLALERFQLLLDPTRRDVFVDPRIEVGAIGQNEVDFEVQNKLLEDLLTDLVQVEAWFEELDQAESVMRRMELRVKALNQLAEIQTRVEDVISRDVLTDPNLRLQFERRIRPSLELLRRRAGTETEGPDPTVQLRHAVARMQEAWDAQDFEACVDTYEMIIDVVAVDQVVGDPEIGPMLDEMESIYLASSTALEFMEKTIEVTGRIVFPAGESVAAVNGAVYREGDALEDDLFLLEIHEDHLVFEFRGIPLKYDY